jgi:hypothetical protein
MPEFREEAARMVIETARAIADVARRTACALAAHPGSFFTIPHFDGYRAVLIRLPQVTGVALREAITDGWLACARLARISSPVSSPPSCHPIGRHDSVALDREC